MPDGWLPERREIYLLRQDVRSPLSVDRSVWPPVFRFNDEPDATHVTTSAPHTLVYEALDLWDDVDAMRQMLTARALRAGTFRCIAIELWLDANIVEDPSWRFLATSLPTNESIRNWRMLGHDVADRDFVSGLSNCSYSKADREQLKGWAQHINEHGLIDDLSHAHEFRDISNSRVRDHAPFFVYRIYADIENLK